MKEYALHLDDLTSIFERLKESCHNDHDKRYLKEAITALKAAEKCLDIGNLKTSRTLGEVRSQIYKLEKELEKLT